MILRHIPAGTVTTRDAGSLFQAMIGDRVLCSGTRKSLRGGFKQYCSSALLPLSRSTPMTECTLSARRKSGLDVFTTRPDQLQLGSGR